MVSDAAAKRAAQKKAAAAAKRGGKASASSKAAAAATAAAVDKVSNGVGDLVISDRNCTGILCSHPMSRDVRVSFFDRFDVDSLVSHCLLCGILLLVMGIEFTTSNSVVADGCHLLGGIPLMVIIY